MTLGPSLSRENEQPLPEPPDIPLWSENYCFQAYDPGAELGVWLHIGRPVYDSDIWHDFTVIYLPGGEDLLIVKGFAPNSWQPDIGPVGAMLRCDYDPPTGDWLVRFHGVAHRVTRTEQHRSVMREAVARPVRLELRFRGLSPVWDLSHDIGEQAFAMDGAHWEQPSAATGWIEIEGERFDFDGTGTRDHSRGKRDTTYMGPHFWLHGAFPSGRCFGLLYVAGMPGQPVTLCRAYSVYDGKLEEAEVLELPADRMLPEPFEIRIRDSAGTHRIRGELLHDFTMSFFAPNEILLGRDLEHAERFMNEGMVRWTWDDEIGYGLGERTVRMGPDRRLDEASTSPVILG